jgi:hypothetical protein
MRFATAANTGLRPWRPYWLIRLDFGHKLPPRPWSVRLSRWRRLGRLAVRFSADPRGLKQAFADCLVASRPGRPDSCSSGVWHSRDRPNRAPLLRFVPLQRLLAALRYPRLPASGRSRYGFGWRLMAPPEYQGSGEARPACPCGLSQPIHSGHHRMPVVDAAHCGSCIGALESHDVPLPADHERHAVPPQLSCLRRRSWGFALRRFAPAREV